MPKESGGKFDFIKCVKWRIEQLEKEVQKGNYLSREEVAALLGYKNERYINELENEFGLPKDQFNKYDVRKVVKWFIEYKENMHQKEILKIKEGNNRDRLDKANAELKEIELSIKQGSLIEARYLQDVIENQANIFINGIRVLGTKIPNLLNLTPQQKEVLEVELTSIRDQIAALPTDISATAINIS